MSAYWRASSSKGKGWVGWGPLGWWPSTLPSAKRDVFRHKGLGLGCLCWKKLFHPKKDIYSKWGTEKGGMFTLEKGAKKFVGKEKFKVTSNRNQLWNSQLTTRKNPKSYSKEDREGIQGGWGAEVRLSVCPASHPHGDKKDKEALGWRGDSGWVTNWNPASVLWHLKVIQKGLRETCYKSSTILIKIPPDFLRNSLNFKIYTEKRTTLNLETLKKSSQLWGDVSRGDFLLDSTDCRPAVTAVSRQTRAWAGGWLGPGRVHTGPT